MKLVRAHPFAFVVACLLAAGVVAQTDGDDRPTPETSEIVYPEATRRIAFDHARHADVACATCHGAASTSRRASDDLSPGMEACATCHTEQAPKLAECGACHVGHPVRAPEPVEKPEQWRAVRPAPMKVPKQSPRIRFDHRLHVEKVSAASPDALCTRCHAADASGAPSMPTMQSCNTCHDGDRAPDACATCHPTDPASGRIKTSFGGRSKARVLSPTNHGVDFRHRHAAAARARSAECSSCHVEEDCAGCHVEQVSEPFAVHPPNYLIVHSIDARSSMGNCTDCHAVQTFCTSCHVRSKVTTRPESDPPARLDFHPPGWLDASMPNNHGVMARRNITDCASCHTETDCITCHTGIDPHPPEFRLDCGRWLRANPRACAKCHADLSAIRPLCR